MIRTKTRIKILTLAIWAAAGLIVLIANIVQAEEIQSTPTLQAQYLFELTTGDENGGMLNQPSGVKVDGQGNVYVADTINSRVIVFDQAGAIKQVIGSNGDGEGQLAAPMALALDAKGENIYVADSSNHRIQIFTTAGVFVRSIELNKDRTEQEKEVRPIGIAVNKDGKIYISDGDNNFIRIYSSSGEMLRKFGGFGSKDGEFCIPVGVFVDTKNQVYVVDMNNSRLQVFDQEGGFISKFGEAGDTKGCFGKVKDVCVDEQGRIYVSDAANLVVQVFDSAGGFLGLIGAEKEAELQFASPFGLAVREGQLYVTDRWRNSVRVYKVKI